MDEWYYTRSEQKLGPVSLFELRKMVVNGFVAPDDLVWRQGMESWERAGENATLAVDFKARASMARATQRTPPPIPPSMPPPVPPAAPQPSAAPYRPAPSHMYAPGDTNVPGSPWSRIGAALIDSAIGVLLTVLVPLFFGQTSDALVVLPSVLMLVYFVAMHASPSQATLGKMACGLIVVGRDGRRISVLRSLGRYLLFALTSLTGVLLIVFLTNRRRMGLHDMGAGTVVIKKSTYDPSTFEFNSVDGGSIGAGTAVALILAVLVVPIGGILAAIAIPAYQDYMVRAKVSSAVMTASRHKTAITEYLYEYNGADISNYEDIGVSGGYTTDDGAAVIDFFSQGDIQVTMQIPPVEGMKFSIFPTYEDGDIVWNCAVIDIPVKYMPSMCR